jgi:hypothetical protein
VGDAFIIGVGRLESGGDRLRASALPAESAPISIAKYIDGKRRTMKQPVIEAMAFSGKVEFGLPQENALSG